MMYGTPFGQPVSFGSAADRKPSFAAVFALVASTSFGFPDIVGQLLRQLAGLADGESFFFKAGGSRRGKLSVQSGNGTTASLGKNGNDHGFPASQLKATNANHKPWGSSTGRRSACHGRQRRDRASLSLRLMAFFGGKIDSRGLCQLGTTGVRSGAGRIDRKIG